MSHNQFQKALSEALVLEYEQSVPNMEPHAFSPRFEKQMRAAAAELNFEMAAELRDRMIELKKNLMDFDER